MSSFQIIVGSMLGGTEYVAEACEKTLESLNHQVALHLKPNFSDILSDTNLSENPIWLICTSTHGAGDYPDNFIDFARDLENCDQDLSTIRFLTIGVGDSSYDTFCQAAKNISNLLKSKDCKEIVDLYTLDMSQEIDPEELSQAWITQHSDLY